MPTTFHIYDHTVDRFNQGLNAPTDVYRVMLLTAAATFNSAHTTLSEVTNAGAYEVSGNGWPVGGEVLANVSIANKKFDADDVSVAVSGGDVGPTAAYVIYNATDANSPPLAYVQLETPQTSTSGNAVGIQWDANGILEWTIV